MDHLQANFKERCNASASTEALYFSATSSIVLLILNIPGNLLLILAVVIDPFKNLRNPFNYLMINLAVADLIAGMIADPLNISTLLKKGLKKSISDAETKTLHMLFFISCTAAILTIASLSVERYYAICYPHTYRRKITRKRALWTLFGIWLISLTLPFVYFPVGYITCSFILVNTTAFVAITITCFTYGFMIYKFNRHKKCYQNATTDDDCYSEGDSVSTISGNIDLQVAKSRPNFAMQHKADIWEQKVTKRFLVVMVALLVWYCPATIFIYITRFCKSCSCTVLYWLRELQMLFLLTNCSMNFFFYGLSSPRFRQAFAHILRPLKMASAK